MNTDIFILFRFKLFILSPFIVVIFITLRTHSQTAVKYRKCGAEIFCSPYFGYITLKILGREELVESTGVEFFSIQCQQ